MPIERQHPDKMSAERRAVWDRAAADSDGRVIELLAQAPEVLSWYLDRFYRDLFFAGSVPVRLKELARLRLSLLHGCGT